MDVDMEKTKTLTKFVIEPSKALFCPLCNNLLNDPVISLSCGHTFCRLCVTTSTVSVILCPLDENKIMNTVANHAVKGQIDDLMIYCCHGLYRVNSDEDIKIDKSGCTDQIALGKRLDHEEKCRNALIPCPNNLSHCGMFRRYAIEDHLLVCDYHFCRNSVKGMCIIFFLSQTFSIACVLVKLICKLKK